MRNQMALSLNRPLSAAGGELDAGGKR